MQELYIAEAKKYEELDFTDDFMFCKILTSNLELCKALLEIILGKKIRKIELSEAQKSIQMTYDGKGVRFDVYVEDEDNTVYDLEMQAVENKNLPKRSRYYQGMIDLNLINKGDNYKKLRKSYIIFICKFDPFDAGLSRYTFKNLCVENPAIALEDEAEKIFINPHGRTENMSPELREFLDYLCGKESESTFTKNLAREVEKARKQEEWKVEYMTLLMRDQENIEKGIERGKEIGRKEGQRAKQEQLIKNMLKNKMSAEAIAEVCDIPLEYVKEVEKANIKK